MVNEEFKREIEKYFLRGLEETLKTLNSDSSDLTIKDKSSIDHIKESEFFVLTISSQLFRVFLLLHFTRSTQTMGYVSSRMNAGGTSVDADKFYDFLGELGNTCCGSLKRDISKIVPSLGMSTPNRLTRDCLKYMKLMKIDFEKHAVAELDGAPLLYASMYLSADNDLNYKISSLQTTDTLVETGDLEFF